MRFPEIRLDTWWLAVITLGLMACAFLGVGLAIHERPLVAGSSTGTLAAGMAITIEPGIYLPGRGGVRIEDTVLVEDAGYRSLVALPRELAVVH